MTAAIILAAGSSSRMGQPKQMLDILGEPLLLKTVSVVTGAGVRPAVVVLGFNERQHREILKDSPVDIVVNENWQKGMGSSIKAGLEQVLHGNPRIDALVIAVCDQPLLSTAMITNLISKHQQTRKPIIASAYSGVPGVPALFHKACFATLKQLPDDQGAKKLIVQNMAEVELVPFPGGEVDLDTMEDYKAFLKTNDTRRPS